MSVKGGLAAIVVIILRSFLGKAPKKYSYLLWSVVAFRLICPVSFRSFFSIFSIFSPNAPTLPSIGGDVVLEGGLKNELLNVEINLADSENVSVEFLEKASFIEIFNKIVMIIWIVVAIALLCYNFYSYFALKRKMQFAVRYEGNVYMSELVSSPFALGFFSPRIYIPYGLNEDTASQVIAHEKYHVKRLDHIIKPIAFLILSVHWFNPMCWLAYRLMTLDMEMSCDESVLNKQGDDYMKKNYSKALLFFASEHRFPASSPIAFSESSINAKKRIKHTLDFKKPKLYVNLICILICIAALVACAADATGYKWKEVKTESFGEVPYNLIYQSYGDGSCAVVEIRVDKDHSGDIHLKIPEYAPNGDKVIAINNVWGLANQKSGMNLPIVLTHDSMSAIVDMIESSDIEAGHYKSFDFGSNKERDARIFKAFYAEKVSDDGVGYYLLESLICFEERDRLASLLYFYGYDEEKAYEDTVSFLNALKSDEAKSSYAREAFKYLYHNGENITEITIPESVKTIGYGSFDGCTSLKRINGISNDCVLIIEGGLTTGLTKDISVVINGTPKEKLYGESEYHKANEDFINALD